MYPVVPGGWEKVSETVAVTVVPSVSLTLCSTAWETSKDAVTVDFASTRKSRPASTETETPAVVVRVVDFHL